MVIKNGKMELEEFGTEEEEESREETHLWKYETTMKKRLEQQQDLAAFCHFYYPNKEKLVINALIASLSISDNNAT